MAEFEAVRDSIDLREYCDAHGMERRGRDNYVCPACGSGNGKNHTAAFGIYNGNRWKCHACDRGGDVFDLEGILRGTEDKLEQLRGVCEWAGITDSDSAPTMAAPPKRYQPPADYTAGRASEAAYIQAMRANVRHPEAVKYIEGRGFTVDEAEYFGMGYDPNRHRLVIPWMGSDYYHIDRDIYQAEGNGKYLKPERDKVGAQPLYNPGALESSAFFVVEGVLDALAVTVCGFDAIAIGGTGARAAAEAMAAHGTRGVAIVMLDNDKAGRETTAKLLELLRGKGIAATTATTKTKDAGEWLKADRDGLGAFLEEQHEAAEAALRPETGQDGEIPVITENYRHRDAVADLDAFIEAIQGNRFEPLATGMQSFDKLLGGGIMRQSLVVLSAAPGAGKTALASQVFEQFAANGNPVLFLNLEMSREYLLARSLSRMLHRTGYQMTATDVLRGYRWSEDQRAHVLEAAAGYRQRIAPNLEYNPHGDTTDIRSIENTLNIAAARYINEGKPAPVVVLDYLHLLSADRMDAQETVKAGIAMLKNYAIRYNTFALAISATNRDSNKSGTITQNSSRDSSAIEYTADTLLSLNYAALEDGDTKPNSEHKYRADSPADMELLMSKNPREMVVRVLKNRMGAAGGKLYMQFDAAHSVFTPLDRDAERYQPEAWGGQGVTRL